MKNLALCASVMALTACATDYQPTGLAGGFTELQLSENIWRVRFEGNGYTSSERAADFALLRSAELTLKNGFTHFGLADSRADRSNMMFTTPASYSTSFAGNSYGNTFTGTATTRQAGGQVFNISTPSAENLVVMFKEKPEERGIIYDARFVCQSLGSKYRIECSTRP